MTTIYAPETPAAAQGELISWFEARLAELYRSRPSSAAQRSASMEQSEPSTPTTMRSNRGMATSRSVLRRGESWFGDVAAGDVGGVARLAADNAGGGLDAFDSHDRLGADKPVPRGYGVLDADPGAAVDADGDGVAVVAGGGAVVAVHGVASSVEK
jgi:hypothetical protein